MNKGLLLAGLICICFAGLKAEKPGSCNAAFTYSISQNMVFFSPVDSSVYGGFWNFGDGTTQLGFGASHAYLSPGTYIVYHSIQDSTSHCQDSAVQTIQVNFSPSCSIYMQAMGDSNYMGGPPVNPNAYSFIAYPNVVGSSIKSLTWTIDSSVLSNDPYLVHTFNAIGQYNVCVQLQTYSGCVANACKEIVVSRTDSCNLIASYTYHILSGGPDSTTIGFTPSPQDTSLSYNWYFGDGGSSSLVNPYHVYFGKGIFSTSLSINKSYGTNNCQSNYSDQVYVNIGPADTCTLNIGYTAEPGKPNAIDFTASAGQPLSREQWTISKEPDSILTASISTLNPTYVFTQTGSYSVSLVATTQAGCVSTAFLQISIDSIQDTNGPSVNAQELMTYPNPANNLVRLSIPLSSNAPILINVYTVSGKLIRSTQVQGLAGSNQVSLPVQSLPSGMYYIEIQTGNSVSRSRFTKL
jgi:PKD repeat protein